MEESVCVTFPFPKLRYYTYVTLDVLMYVEYPKVYEFMFTVNKATRAFLEDNFIAIRNGFTNEGLITHDIYYCVDKYNQDPPFYGLKDLEKLYFEALSRQIFNRKVTINLIIWYTK